MPEASIPPQRCPGRRLGTSPAALKSEGWGQTGAAFPSDVAGQQGGKAGREGAAGAAPWCSSCAPRLVTEHKGSSLGVVQV